MWYGFAGFVILSIFDSIPNSAGPMMSLVFVSFSYSLGAEFSFYIRVRVTGPKLN